MHSSKFFSVCVLGLLPSLSVAASSPVFSTLDQSFSLHAAIAFREDVVLEFTEITQRSGSTYTAGVARISSNSSNIARFRLTDGNLTMADGSTAAFFPGDFPGLFPPPPLPIYFGDFEARAVGGLDTITPVFFAAPPSSLESELQLFSSVGGGLRPSSS